MAHSIGRRLAIAAVAGSALLASFSAFAAEPAVGDFLGRSEAEVSANLTRQGFKTEEVEHEHGEYRVDVKQTADTESIAWLELHIDPVSGKILKVINDGNDHDDDDDHENDDRDHDEDHEKNDD